MNQHDQMSEALRDTQDFLTECEITLHLDIAQLRILEEKINQALDTEPTPLVRLTDDDIWSNIGILRANADIGLSFDEMKQLINAIMDAMIEKNKGKL